MHQSMNIQWYSHILALTLLIAGCKNTTPEYTETYTPSFEPELLRSIVSDAPAVPDPDPLFRIREKMCTGYIDKEGNPVIPPTFVAAGDFSEGLAAARSGGYYGYIDKTGKFIIPPSYDFATDFSDNAALVYKDGHPIYIDRKGNALFDNPFREAGPFTRGLAMIRTASNKPGVINKKGILVIDTIYTSIYPFKHNLTIAGDQTANNMILLDTTGIRIPPPAGIKDADALKKYYDALPLTGITKDRLIRNGHLVEMGNGVTLNTRHGDVFYTDEKKYVLWQFTKSVDFPHDYDIDYKSTGYYPIKGTAEPIYHCKQALPQGIFSLTVMPDIKETDNVPSNSNGYRTILANRSGHAITFTTYDNALYMQMQAKTNTGNWQDIQGAGHGCANGFQEMTLRSGHYLQLTCPVYSGVIWTKLRLRFTYISYGESHTIYSNEFDGSINPGQLWRAEWKFHANDYLLP